MKRKGTLIAALFCVAMLAAMFFSAAVYAQTINDVNMGPNVALEATATAGHTNPYDGSPACVNDGLLATSSGNTSWNSWSSNGTVEYPVPVTLTWDREYELTGMRVIWWADNADAAATVNVTFPKRCQVQYLDENNRWQTITGMTNEDAQTVNEVGVKADVSVSDGLNGNNKYWNYVTFPQAIKTTSLRLLVERSGSELNGSGISEWEVFGTVSRNVTASAAITAGYTHEEEGGPQNAIDGVLAGSSGSTTWNTWCADANVQYPVPITLEWDMLYELDGMRVIWWADTDDAAATTNVAFPKSCQVQYLDTNGTWQTITGMTNEDGQTVQQVGVKADTKNNGIKGKNWYWNYVKFPETLKTSSIRLMIERSGSEKNGIGISEWQVFGTAPIVEGENIAPSAKASASYTNTSGQVTADNINDRVNATNADSSWNTWSSGGNLTYPQHLMLEWDTPKAIDSMRVMWWADNGLLTADDNVTFPKSCDVEYYDHGTEEWVKITAMTDENGEDVSSVGVKFGSFEAASDHAANHLNGNNRYWNRVVFDKPVKTTKLRLVIDRNGSGRNGVGVGEWKVFGEEITAGWDELIMAEISGGTRIDENESAQYTAISLPAGLTDLNYEWSVAAESKDILAIEGVSTAEAVKVKGIKPGTGVLEVTIFHDENGQTVSRKAKIEIVVEGIIGIETYVTATAAGTAPILPDTVAANGLTFDEPTLSLKSGTNPDFDFGETFEAKLVPVVWEEVDPALYAIGKEGTKFTVKGTVSYRGEEHEARAEITVNPVLVAPEANSTVTFENVQLTDDFWNPKQQVNAIVSLKVAIEKIEQASGGEPNFVNAIKKLNGEDHGSFSGMVFQDSDIYKSIEAISYTLSLIHDETDPEMAAQRAYLEGKLAQWIPMIEQVQYADGYIGTYFTLRDTNETNASESRHRFKNMWDHELYCAGHFLEGAVAYTRYREGIGDPDYRLYVVAKRCADQIVELFGPDGTRHEVPGHEEIEMALVKLAKLVEEYEGAGAGQKYIDTAKVFIDRRGENASLRESGYSGGQYSQDATPITEETNAVGHAVRACYFYTGVTDVATLLPEDDADRIAYLNALDTIWESVTYKKTYITGGIGVRSGSEAFGGDYELPNNNSYCETCASIALANWNLSMNLVHEDAKYIDVVENALYNSVLTGVNLEGNLFYYSSLLEVSNGNGRSEWFACACCPPNLMRTIAKLSEYMYTVHGDDVFLNLYIGSSGNLNVQGTNVAITQETAYPWDGAVKLTVSPAEAKTFTMKVRIPGWVEEQNNKHVTICVNGETITAEAEKGYVSITRTWESGDVVMIGIPMEIRMTEADPNVTTNLGRIALERGPLVYCMEKAGNAQRNTSISNFDPLNFVIPRDAALAAEYKEELLNGVIEITGSVLYQDGADTLKEVQLQAIPYYAWNNRGDNGIQGQNSSSKMLIWTLATGEKPEPDAAALEAAQKAAAAAQKAQAAADTAAEAAETVAAMGEAAAEEAQNARKAADDAQKAAEEAADAAKASAEAAEGSDVTAAEAGAKAAESAAAIADALKQVAQAQVEIADAKCRALDAAAESEAALKAAEEALAAAEKANAEAAAAALETVKNFAVSQVVTIAANVPNADLAVVTEGLAAIEAAESIDAVIEILGDVMKALGVTVDECPSKDFIDVPDETNWAHEGIDYCVANDLMRGVGDGKFNPTGTLTRAELVTVLYRAEGAPEVEFKGIFGDVAEKSWYSAAVEWAAANKIVNGVGDGTSFAPTAQITREQIATILYRYAQFKGYDVAIGEETDIRSYTDYDSISDYAVAAMRYAVGAGVMKGKSETTVNPLDNATRAEIAAILFRFLEANK